MHVVFLGHVARFSGAEIELLRFVRAAPQVRSTVILAEDGPLVPALREAGATVEVIPLPERARSLKRTEMRPGVQQLGAATDVGRYVVALSRRIRALRPDIVSAVSLKAAAYGGIAARLAGRPFVVHLHDQISPTYLSPAAVRPMQLLLGVVPDALISPAQATIDTVGRRRRGNRAFIARHPTPRPAEPAPVRAQVRRIGIIGRITPWKGQDVFLRAFAQAVPEPEITAVVIGAAMFGEESFEVELRELARTLGIEDRVEFTGFREDVFAELLKLDVLVHASVLTEPGGTVVFEAMSAGVPVIAARSGGVAETVQDGRHGLLHEPGDAGGLASALRRMIDEDDLRRAFARAGRELTEENAPERVAARWIEIYTEVLG